MFIELVDLVALDVLANLVEFGGCALQDAEVAAVVEEVVDQDVVILKLLLLNHPHLAAHALLV